MAAIFPFNTAPGNSTEMYPAWCDSVGLAWFFGLFSDACIPKSEEEIYAAGMVDIESMCRRAAEQGADTYEACMSRAAVNEPLFRTQYRAASDSSKAQDPEGFCEYEASQNHPTVYRLLGGKMACEYSKGSYTWLLLAGGVMLAVMISGRGRR